MLRSLISLVTGLGLSTGPVAAPSAEPPLHQVASLKITILSTMLADEGMGEWGFAALVEADGRRILFDTGLHPETVLQNARELGIDLSSVTDVVLSHHHEDHTGGLLALRRELSKRSPMAMSRIHVAPGIFLGRRHPGSEEESNSTIAVKPAMEATGAVFVEHREPAEIFPGVWLTGPVPRPNAERYGRFLPMVAEETPTAGHRGHCPSWARRREQSLILASVLLHCPRIRDEQSVNLPDP